MNDNDIQQIVSQVAAEYEADNLRMERESDIARIRSHVEGHILSIIGYSKTLPVERRMRVVLLIGRATELILRRELPNMEV